MTSKTEKELRSELIDKIDSYVEYYAELDGEMSDKERLLESKWGW